MVSSSTSNPSPLSGLMQTLEGMKNLSITDHYNENEARFIPHEVIAQTSQPAGVMSRLRGRVTPPTWQDKVNHLNKLSESISITLHNFTHTKVAKAGSQEELMIYKQAIGDLRKSHREAQKGLTALRRQFNNEYHWQASKDEMSKTVDNFNKTVFAAISNADKTIEQRIKHVANAPERLARIHERQRLLAGRQQPSQPGQQVTGNVDRPPPVLPARPKTSPNKQQPQELPPPMPDEELRPSSPKNQKRPDSIEGEPKRSSKELSQPKPEPLTVIIGNQPENDKGKLITLTLGGAEEIAKEKPEEEKTSSKEASPVTPRSTTSTEKLPEPWSLEGHPLLQEIDLEKVKNSPREAMKAEMDIKNRSGDIDKKLTELGTAHTKFVELREELQKVNEQLPKAAVKGSPTAQEPSETSGQPVPPPAPSPKAPPPPPPVPGGKGAPPPLPGAGGKAKLTYAQQREADRAAANAPVDEEEFAKTKVTSRADLILQRNRLTQELSKIRRELKTHLFPHAPNVVISDAELLEASTLFKEKAAVTAENFKAMAEGKPKPKVGESKKVDDSKLAINAKTQPIKAMIKGFDIAIRDREKLNREIDGFKRIIMQKTALLNEKAEKFVDDADEATLDKIAEEVAKLEAENKKNQSNIDDKKAEIEGVQKQIQTRLNDLKKLTGWKSEEEKSTERAVLPTEADFPALKEAAEKKIKEIEEGVEATKTQQTRIKITKKEKEPETETEETKPGEKATIKKPVRAGLTPKQEEEKLQDWRFESYTQQAENSMSRYKRAFGFRQEVTQIDPSKMPECERVVKSLQHQLSLPGANKEALEKDLKEANAKLLIVKDFNNSIEWQDAGCPLEGTAFTEEHKEKAEAYAKAKLDDLKARNK